MATVKVRLNKFRLLRDNTYPLVFQVIHQRKKRLIYSGYRIHEENFDQSNGCIVNRRKYKVKEVETINEHIQRTLQKLLQIIDTLDNRPEAYSVSDIIELYGCELDDSCVLNYFRKLVDRFTLEGRNGTAQAYLSTMNCLNRYLDATKKITFEEITPNWVESFLHYLNGSGLKKNTVNFYLRVLRAVYNQAQREDVIGTNSLSSPFRKIRINTIRTAKRAVGEKCIYKIMKEQPFKNQHLNLARDLFMFSFYSRGMPFVDMAFLRHSNIVGDTIYYKRHKTNQELIVKIVPPLRQLIEKYRSKSDFVLPILQSDSKEQYKQYQLALRKYNRDLKKLSETLNLSKPLTSYVARHSWATIAHKSGIPVSVISEGLGHGNERVTYSYLAALNPSALHAANEQVLSQCNLSENQKTNQKECDYYLSKKRLKL